MQVPNTKPAVSECHVHSGIDWCQRTGALWRFVVLWDYTSLFILEIGVCGRGRCSLANLLPSSFEHGEESQGASESFLGLEGTILLLNQPFEPALNYRGCTNSYLDSENNVIHKASTL